MRTTIAVIEPALMNDPERTGIGNLADVIRTVSDLNLLLSDVGISYGKCGSHDVLIHIDSELAETKGIAGVGPNWNEDEL